MLLDQKKFYHEIDNFYTCNNYEDAQEYLKKTEKELKLEIMPDPGCIMCGGGDVDEDGLTETTRAWVKERNQAIATVIYEQGRCFQLQEEWKASMERYQEAKKLMKRSDMIDMELYSALVKGIRLVESKMEQ